MLSRFHLILERKGRADGHSDRRTYIFAISITRVSMLTRDKKRNVYAVRVTFHPCAVLTPKPLVTPWCIWGPMGDVITRAQFQLNQFGG